MAKMICSNARKCKQEDCSAIRPHSKHTDGCPPDFCEFAGVQVYCRPATAKQLKKKYPKATSMPLTLNGSSAILSE